MSDKDRNPHPNSPAGGGGPGGFRTTVPLGSGIDAWAVPISDSTTPNLLNFSVPSELNGHAGWVTNPPASDSERRVILANASDIEKIKLAVERAIPKLPAEMRDKVKAMLTPEALAVLTALAAVWGVSHWFGVGEIVDVVLLGWGVYALGTEAIDIAKELYLFVTTATGAKTDRDLDRAADYFARSIARIGVDGLAVILTHRAFKTVKRLDGTTGKTTPSKPAASPEPPQSRPKRKRTTPSPTGKTIAEDFMRSNRRYKPEKIEGYLDGIDLAKPVNTRTMQPGEKFVVWERQGAKPGEGSWATFAGVRPDEVGIIGSGRSPVTYVVDKPMTVLESTAKAYPKGVLEGIGGTGGAPQLCLPDNWAQSVVRSVR